VIASHFALIHCVAMKRIFPITVLFSLLFILLSGCASTPTGRGLGPFATVQETEGTAEIRKGDDWTPLRKGVRIGEGDSVRTGADSAIQLNFGEYGGTMRITPESQIRIEHFGWSDMDSGRTMHVLVDLQRGRVRGDTLNPAPNSLFQVKTLGGTFDLK
jgi:hypothetical protein